MWFCWQQAWMSTESVATRRSLRYGARRARSYTQTIMGRPEISRNGLRRSRTDSSRAGITPTILSIAHMVYHQIGARGLANHGGGVYTRFTMAEPCALPVGKLPPRFLEALLGSCRPSRSSRVVAGPRFGEDAAVIDLGDSCLVVKTDPITFTSERIGWYAVNINANDVACLGARPRWFLATLLL